MTQLHGTTHTATLLGLLLVTNSLVHAFLPITPVVVRSSLSGQTLVSKVAVTYLSFHPASPAFNHAPLTLGAAAMDDDEGTKDKMEEELEHELPVGEHEEEGAEAAGKPAVGAAPTTVVDDVFNSVPFLQKRKEAMEKEMASIDENLQTLQEQFGELAGEWDGKVAVMQKDYDNLKAKYYNDTLEVATTGRSNVFVEIMGVVDDFERARMAYKPGGEEEAAILESYEGVKDAIVKGMMNEGLVEVKTVGEPFDFKLHDCMFTEASDEWPEDIITREFSKGFMIGEKVVRPAKVACSLGPGP
jgi:molecular chaperone GrpE